MAVKSIFKRPNGHSPVDRHVVDWFYVYVSDRGCRVASFQATYFARAAYTECFPNERRGGGADFVDQWLVCEDGKTIGRWNHWEFPFKDNDYWLNCRTTMEAARERAVSLLTERILSHRSVIETLEQSVRANLTEGEKVSDGHNS